MSISISSYHADSWLSGNLGTCFTDCWPLRHTHISRLPLDTVGTQSAFQADALASRIVFYPGDYEDFLDTVVPSIAPEEFSTLQGNPFAMHKPELAPQIPIQSKLVRGCSLDALSFVRSSFISDTRLLYAVERLS